MRLKQYPISSRRNHELLMKHNNNYLIRTVCINKIKEQEIVDIKNIINKSKRATIFHTYEWNKALYKSTKIRFWIILVYEQEEPISLCYMYLDKRKGFIKIAKSPNVTLGSIYGGPISVSGKDEMNTYIINNVNTIIKSNKYTFVTYPHYQEKIKDEKVDKDYIKTNIIQLDLTKEQLLNNCNKNTRWSVRKAKKQGVEVIQVDEKFANEYHSMIEETFDGTPLTTFPLTYYETIIKELLSKGFLKFLIAKYDSKYIAGAIFLCYNKTIYYWHGSSYKKYRHLCPNHLIQWEMISWANAKGYKYYDLMIVEEKRLPGIAHFKKSWGGTVKTIPKYQYETRSYKFIKQIKSIVKNTKKYGK